MARVSQEVTAQELAAYDSWVKDNNIVNNDQNALVVAKYMLEVWGVEITRENLDKALPQLKASLTFYTPLEAEYLSLTRRMTPEQVQTVLNFITRRGLKDGGDDQLNNFITIASWVLDKNQSIEVSTLDSALGNIMNHSRKPLLWKTRLQDSEKEAQAKHEAAKQQSARQDSRTELVGESTLAPHLREHRRQMQAALAEAAAKKAAESQPLNQDSEWKNRAESAVASIQSNLDRAEAEKFLQKAGAWGWELVHKNIINFVERRKQERSMAGR